MLCKRILYHRVYSTNSPPAKDGTWHAYALTDFSTNAPAAPLTAPLKLANISFQQASSPSILALTSTHVLLAALRPGVPRKRHAERLFQSRCWPACVVPDAAVGIATAQIGAGMIWVVLTSLKMSSYKIISFLTPSSPCQYFPITDWNRDMRKSSSGRCLVSKAVGDGDGC